MKTPGKSILFILLFLFQITGNIHINAQRPGFPDPDLPDFPDFPIDICDIVPSIPLCHCNDGLQNYGETGVDCGGNCEDCPPSNACIISLSSIIGGGDYCLYTYSVNAFTTPDCGPLTYNWVITNESGQIVYNYTGPSSQTGLIAMYPETYNVSVSVTSLATGVSESTSSSFSCDNDDHCNNGVQDYNEIGIDCGGIDCPPCPTCNDGIQNGNETGIDCGGLDCFECCDLCPLEGNCNDGIQNGNELGVDCGGRCYEMCVDLEVADNCNQFPPPPSCLCNNGVQDPGEADVDCGGACQDCGSLTSPNTGGSSLQSTNPNNIFVIYPNPVQRQFMLNYQLPNTEVKGLLQLINAQGQQVLVQEIEGAYHQQQFNVADLPNGFYFLSVQSEGAILYQSKIVINN